MAIPKTVRDTQKSPSFSGKGYWHVRTAPHVRVNNAPFLGALLPRTLFCYWHVNVRFCSGGFRHPYCHHTTPRWPPEPPGGHQHHHIRGWIVVEVWFHSWDSVPQNVTMFHFYSWYSVTYMFWKGKAVFPETVHSSIHVKKMFLSHTWDIVPFIHVTMFHSHAWDIVACLKR